MVVRSPVDGSFPGMSRTWILFCPSTSEGSFWIGMLRWSTVPEQLHFVAGWSSATAPGPMRATAPSTTGVKRRVAPFNLELVNVFLLEDRGAVPRHVENLHVVDERRHRRAARPTRRRRNELDRVEVFLGARARGRNRHETAPRPQVAAPG